MTTDHLDKSEINLPLPTEEGLRRFLESPFIKGVGKVYAERIIDKYGLKLLDSNMDWEIALTDIEGLGKDKIASIKESLSSLKVSAAILAILYSTGISDSDVEKIYSHYGNRVERVLQFDPYDMVENVWKLSFFTADKIGNFLKIDKKDPRRLRGAILTAIKLFAEDGDLYATESQTIEKTRKILGDKDCNIELEINNLLEDGRIKKSYDGLYLPVYYKAEKETSEKLLSIIKKEGNDIEHNLKIPDKDLYGNKLTALQKDAIVTVVGNRVSIITGGPGTGKTTTISGVINLFLGLNKKIVLAAPTGRAAKRISELTGKEATTIHRLLGYSLGKGYKNKKLDVDILILDEASMLEQVLFNHLLQAINDKTRIVLVGDTDQLPAIGAGNVLKDMIESGTVPVIKLNENFRQKDGSGITDTALAIKDGEDLINAPSSDFIFVKEDSVKTTKERIFSLITKELPSYVGIKSNQILLVTPQQEGPLGAKQLNLELQERVNPRAPEIKKGIKRFRLGDRVMQTVNSRLRYIFNGEIGIVTSLDSENQNMEVTFGGGKKSIYDLKSLKELTLAYATTVHKLQGSETDYMVLVMSSSHKPLLYRNLLYTGVSRAKKLCVIVGEEKAVKMAIATNDKHARNSNLKKRLMSEG